MRKILPIPKHPDIINAPVKGYRVRKKFAWWPTELYVLTVQHAFDVKMLETHWVWAREYYIIERLQATSMSHGDVTYGWCKYGTEYLTQDDACMDLKKYEHEQA